MSNFLEIIKQLKSNQEAFEDKLTKIESLGGNVNKVLLRELIQDARELHEGAVILSYVLFDEQSQRTHQLEMNLSQENQEVPERFDEITKESVDNLQKKSLDVEQTNQNHGVDFLENQNDVPSEESIVEHLENEISSIISENTSGVVFQHQEEEDNSLAAKLARKKIDNLSSAIGINEKFLFTNELFDGNTEQFLKTIDELNSCLSLKDANEKLTEFAQKRDWMIEEEPYQKLQSLLTRKYQ